MLSIEDESITIKVCDDAYDCDRFGIVERLLDALEYELIVDFRIHISTGKFIGYRGNITPKNDNLSFLDALKEIENMMDEIDVIDEDETELSFEVLLLK